MIHLFKNNQTHAKVIDGKLILTCPAALTPVVWQMDLIGAKNSAFEVNKDEGSKAYTLISRKQGAAKSDIIATFEKREEAVQALMVTSKALENAHGQIYMAAVGTTTETTSVQAPHIIHTAAPQKKGNLGKVLAGLAGIIVIFVLIGMIQSVKPGKVGLTSSSSAYSSSGTSASAPTESGVPMSADDYLRQN